MKGMFFLNKFLTSYQHFHLNFIHTAEGLPGLLKIGASHC